MIEFKLGDIVELKSGGPAMTIIGLPSEKLGSLIQIAWFSGNDDEIRVSHMPAFALVKCDDQA